MEETLRLTKSPRRVHQQRPEFIDDECSTDSGCSSGGSTGSAEHLSRPRINGRGSSFRYSHRSHHHHDHHDHHDHHESLTRSQERLSRVMITNQRGRTNKSSRSWSPSELRQDCNRESSSYSSSPSDAQSSDSDSLNRATTTETIRRALQCLKIKWEPNSKEKKHSKKSPKRILRDPVTYIYVKGISGLPTQRVPRNTLQQISVSNSYPR